MAAADGEELDLSHLSEEEREIILSVIKKDLQLKRETLRSLETAVLEVQENSTIGKRANKNQQKKCSCCSSKQNDGLIFLQCSQCGNLACKKCIKKGTNQSICKTCNTQWNLKLLSNDLKLGNLSDYASSQLTGSQLLQKSLEHKKETTNLKKVCINETVDSQLQDVPVHLEKSFAIPSEEGENSFMKPALDDSESAEIRSLYSEPCFEVNHQISGSVKLGAWYTDSEKILYVRIAEANGLASVDGSSTDLNPYIKVYLLPGMDKQNKRRTGIQRETNQPQYNEIVKYKVDREKLGEHILWVSVWDWNILGMSRFLGETCLPLSTLDLSNTNDIEYALKNHEEKVDETDYSSSSGKICIALKFSAHEPKSSTDLSKPHPLADALTRSMPTFNVHVKRAANLSSMHSGDDINPFVCCYLLPNVRSGGKRKSATILKTLNPEWDEEFSYKMVFMEDLKTERALEVTVWDMDRRGTNSFIGCVRVGPNPLTLGNAQVEDWMDSSGEEVAHWEEMLAQPGEWVERWHTLRSSRKPLRKKGTAERDVPEIKQLKSHEAEYEEEINTDGQNLESEHLERNEKKSNKKPSISEENDQPNSETDHIIVSRRPKGEHYKVSGEVELSLHYRNTFYGRTLTVHVVRASGLAAVDKFTHSSSPYVKMYLLPGTHAKRKTKVKRRTVNPTFEQSFDFSISRNKMRKSCLWITVWSHEVLQPNQFLGETWIRFKSTDYDSDKPFKENRKLKLKDAYEATN